MDLGAGVGQTLRCITFPMLRSALVAGALLAVVAAGLTLLSIVPVWLAQPVSGDTGPGRF